MKKLLRAAWIAPITTPPAPDAAILMAHRRIFAVGPADQLLAAHPDAAIFDLGQSILLPGLINPHTHLELSTCTDPTSPPASFAEWLLSIRERMGLTADNVAEVVSAAVRTGVRQSLHAGVTCIGDISQHCSLSRQVLRDHPIRAISYGEALGLAMARPRFEMQLHQALDRSHESGRLRVGLSPHAPYSVDHDGYRQCVNLAAHHRLPLCTHLAESPDETRFLQHHAGPFRDIWNKLGSWNDHVPAFDGGPVDLAAETGLLKLDPPALLAHVNYCDDRELDLLAAGNASIVWCPRTHAYFGHPPHRWLDMLARGINVAIGTDSCASSPDLNPVHDLNLLHRRHPDLPPHLLWEMITIRAARALGLHQQIGSLEPQKAADIAIFNIQTDNPLLELLEYPRPADQIWLDGEKIDLPLMPKTTSPAASPA